MEDGVRLCCGREGEKAKGLLRRQKRRRGHPLENDPFHLRYPSHRPALQATLQRAHWLEDLNCKIKAATQLRWRRVEDPMRAPRGADADVSVVECRNRLEGVTLSQGVRTADREGSSTG